MSSKIKDATLETLRDAATSEAKAVAFMESRRWPNGAACVACGSVNVYAMLDSVTGERNKDWRWRCRDCKKMFTVRMGTILEHSRLPVRAWVHAFHRACASKKGISALQLQRELGVNYKTALYLLNRVREAMGGSTGPLGGADKTVEMDETYCGGRPRNPRPGNQGTTEKTPVVAIVERGGNVKFQVMARVTTRNLAAAVAEHVDLRSRLNTDDSPAYTRMGKMFHGGHGVVNHKRRDYARSDGTHSNTVEGVFSLLKRGLYGTFHSVSKKHLHRYLNEFEFRHNLRFVSDAERTGAAIAGAEGKRLLKAEVALG